MSFFCAFVLTWLAATIMLVFICWLLDDFSPYAFDDLFEDFSLSGLRQKGRESGLLGIFSRLFRGLLFMPGLCFWALVAVLFRGIVQLNQKTRKWFGYREEDENEC